MSKITVALACDVSIEGDDDAEVERTRKEFELACAGWRELLEASLAQHLEGKGLNVSFGDPDDEEWRG
jgi:hypothetical protein